MLHLGNEFSLWRIFTDKKICQENTGDTATVKLLIRSNTAGCTNGSFSSPFTEAVVNSVFCLILDNHPPWEEFGTHECCAMYSLGLIKLLHTTK